jgi:hypothetical protein
LINIGLFVIIIPPKNMNIAETQCQKCPVRQDCAEELQTMPDEDKTVRAQTCPPQTKTVRLYKGYAQNEISFKDALSGLSNIRQDVYVRYHCPLGERRLFVDTLEKLITPRRDQLVIFPPTPLVDVYVKGEIQSANATRQEMRRFARERRTHGSGR